MAVLRNEQREHLKILREKSPEAVVDMCKLAIDYLNNGPNEKKYSTVAKKLNTSSDIVQPTIEALVCLLIDATKSNVNETEFENLKTSGFSSDQISILWQFVSSKRNFVEHILRATSPREFRYRDLEWRLDGKIASRSLLYQATPVIIIKLHLDTEKVSENRSILGAKHDESKKKYETAKQFLIETDPNNLLHIIDVLERALMETKTHRMRDMMKALQV